MALQSLVMCRDARVLGVLRRALRHLEIGAEVLDEPDSALEMLRQRRFEAVIVDFSIPGAVEVLQTAGQSGDKKIIISAILNAKSSVRDAFEMGANLVFYAPLTLDRATHGMRAARNLMFPQQRRYYRQRVHTPVYLSFDGVHEIKSVVLDLSEGGMSVRLLEPAQDCQSIHFRFDLPGGKKSIEARGEIAWADSQGRAGIRFAPLAKGSQKQLRNWLCTVTEGRAGNLF